MRCGCFIAPGRGSSLLRSLLWDVTASLPPRQSCCYFPALCRVSPSPRAPCHRELTLSHTLQAHSASPFIYHHLSGFYRHLMYFGCGISPKTFGNYSYNSKDLLGGIQHTIASLPGSVFEAERPGCKFTLKQRIATYFIKVHCKESWPF
ncbi:Protein RETICULATA-RELATED 1 [Arachis hypogaea]|nr:Protein RETICULATA-RELATED 1 [Arachis hypogaea]